MSGVPQSTAFGPVHFVTSLTFLCYAHYLWTRVHRAFYDRPSCRHRLSSHPSDLHHLYVYDLHLSSRLSACRSYDLLCSLCRSRAFVDALLECITGGFTDIDNISYQPSYGLLIDHPLPSSIMNKQLTMPIISPVVLPSIFFAPRSTTRIAFLPGRRPCVLSRGFALLGVRLRIRLIRTVVLVM